MMSCYALIQHDLWDYPDPTNLTNCHVASLRNMRWGEQSIKMLVSESAVIGGKKFKSPL